jgi:hypothetical protein
MNKSSHFTGQPVFGQLLSFLPKKIIYSVAQEYNSDRYCKGFDTWAHLVSMLFACFGNCTSLREITSGMRALEGRLQYTGLKKFPARSTFSDANSRRSEAVFEQIYYRLKSHWEPFLPDSRTRNKVRIFDSTTISLFKEIFRGSGLSKQNGRRKGGLKVHVTMQDGATTASSIMFTDGASNDMVLLANIDEQPEDILVFDRGYRSYSHYQKWTSQGTLYVTRFHENTYILEALPQPLAPDHVKGGVLSDQLVKIGHPAKKNTKIQARLVTYKDPSTGKVFKILSNYYSASPVAIAHLYKKRWQIETLFKRLKQNMPLNYFLGDNQNAIKIQIWCAFIADFLLQLAKLQVRRRWAFSNISNLVRLHLFNYVNLIAFLEQPEKCRIEITPYSAQHRLELSG